MFGFWRRKCRNCGETLESMDQSGDRTDDLIKGSAINGRQVTTGLCARCRAIAGSGARRPVPQQSEPPAPPPTNPAASVPRTVASVPRNDAEQTNAAYQPGDGSKTEPEPWRSVFDEPSVDGYSIAKALFSWIVGTDVGRKVGLAIIFFFAMIAASIFDDAKVDSPADEAAVADLPPPAMPPTSSTAQPSNNPGSWVTTNDYPPRALQEERQGTTGFMLWVDAEGRVDACEIIQSSGHVDLDAATCSAVKRRARFQPASDGDSIRTYRNRVTWRIPE
jgi:TonB family protein